MRSTTQQSRTDVADRFAEEVKTKQDMAAFSRLLVNVTVDSSLVAEMEAHPSYAMNKPGGRGNCNNVIGFKKTTELQRVDLKV